MNNYTTRDNCIPLSINGVAFSFNADSEFSKKLSALADEVSNKKKDSESDDEVDVSAFLSYIVDSLLGDGAVERIFGDILPDPLDLCDIISYVADAFGDYRKRRIAALKEV